MSVQNRTHRRRLQDTDPTTLEAATHAHSGQGLIHATAVAQATGLTVREVVFVYPRVQAEWAMTNGPLASTPPY